MISKPDRLKMLKRDVCETFRFTGNETYPWLGPWECNHGTHFRAYQITYGQHIATPTVLLQNIHAGDYRRWRDRERVPAMAEFLRRDELQYGPIEDEDRILDDDRWT